MQSRSWRCQYGLRCETLENKEQAPSIATLVDSTKSRPRVLKDALNNLVIRAVASCGACAIGNYIDLEIISAATYQAAMSSVRVQLRLEMKGRHLCQLEQFLCSGSTRTRVGPR